ncbi:MAG: TIGR03792 family protein [Chroococcidiopsidaceae cyanobacterium CP_BM_ER_R8_30]|nr:TIGR03792 family protein [Chroococcidiopsidaceae cyanobacterium CP_BM_ER_R8_30]
MIIEFLKFKVVPELREKFIQKAAEIWTTVLASCSGFLGKEVWINPNNTTEVILVIQWESHEQQSAIPQRLLDATEKKFAQQMGNTYCVSESDEYQVRKYS